MQRLDQCKMGSLRLLLIAAACLLLTTAHAKLLIDPFDTNDEMETKGLKFNGRVDDNSADNYRLPNNTIPVHYDVELSTSVHTGERAFTGKVVIELNVIEDTRTIVMHMRQLTIESASITRKDTTPVTTYTMTTEYESTRQFLSFTPTDTTASLQAGTTWLLTINYNGSLRTDNGGFYISTYTDESGAIHYLATTQFESTDARHAFPCYDEPSKRATFDITITHDPSYSAISNMPVNADKSSTGVTAFNTTVVMSTYLVAFIVSDFEYTEAEFNGVKQRVYTRPGTKGQQEWALVSGLLVEKSLAGYFDVPFALPKLDQAGIPDFAAGAMENWGLATYRQQYMVWSKENSTVNTKTSISNIIGHEYAHMWFGDFVSIKWWTYLWLKEGFATIFSYESDDIAYPEWDIYQIYHVSDYNSALINDASATATPMTHYVQTPNEISARYNTFSYAKPSAVLYMFKNAWTDKVFRLGLHKYLSDHAFTSCDEWDLFASLQEAADESGYTLPDTVANIFSSWSHKGGYPLLTVERNYETGTFTVKQQQFLNNKDLTNDKLWYIPINYATASDFDYRDTSASHYLRNVAEYTVSDAQISSDDWLLLNKQSSGYYRILYDTRNYNLIAQGLLTETYKWHPRNRAQLMHDAYRFVVTERLDHAVLLNLMAYLQNEDQYAPWSTANSIFTAYDVYLRGDDQYDEYRGFIVDLVEDIFLRVGVNEKPGEHYLNNYLRVTLMSLACQMGSEKCYELAHRKLKEYFSVGTFIEPTVRTQTHCAGLRKAEDYTFNAVYNALLSSTVSTDRSLYISSLGCSQTASQLKKFVESSIDTTNSLSTSERTSLLSAAYTRGEAGLTASLDFLETNWEAYGNLGTGTSKPLNTAIRGMAAYVTNEKQKTRLNALVATVEDSDLVNTGLSSGVNASIQANFDWLASNRNPIINFVSEFRSDKDNGSSTLIGSIVTILAALILQLTMK